MESEVDPNMPIPQRFKVARIIGVSFLGALGMYVLLVVLIRLPAGVGTQRPVEPALRAGVWLFGLAAIAAGLTLTDRLVPRRSPATDHEVASILVVRMIIRLAFLDAAAVGGLLIFFSTQDWYDFAALTALAGALTLAKQPSRAEWLDESRAAGLSWPL